MKLFIRTRYQKTKALYQKYEAALMPAVLVLGFVPDYITFKTINPKTALTVLSCYFIVASALIAFIQYYDSGRVTRKLKFVRLFAPLLIQFLFGALLGAIFIFYWFSASIAASWMFIIILLGLIVSNEFFKRHIAKPVAQAGLYYFIMFSFFSIVVPYAFNGIGARLFLLAGIASLVFMFAYVNFLSLAQSLVHEKKQIILRVALVIFIAMNALYFANIIPPIPLCLRQAGIYHNVKRSGAGYALTQEHESFFRKIIPGKEIHLRKGGRAFAYTSIFAPNDLKTKIFHHWQYYNEALGAWVERDKLSFNITGGRKEGFRGYSVKSAVEPGKWRILVKTDQGQTLGRISFRIKEAKENIKLEEIVR